MKKIKEPLSVTKRYTIRYTITGIFWLLYSVFNLMPARPLQIISALFLFSAAFCSFFTLFAKQEPDDEMSYEHIWIAKSISHEILLCALIIVGIFSMFMSFPFSKAYGFFVALSQILPGLLFAICEKEGF
jgi:nitrate reductase NapE component